MATAGHFLDIFSVVKIGKKEGYLSAQLIRTKAVDYLADSLVASSCLNNKLILATRNKKHFIKVRNLKIIGDLQELKLN